MFLVIDENMRLCLYMSEIPYEKELKLRKAAMLSRNSANKPSFVGTLVTFSRQI